jgi:outer membrane lipoprotein-sorting protein
MDGLSKIKSATAEYSEDQYLKMLTKPLHATGMLVYLAPDHLEKNTLTPKPQSMAIDGDTLTMRQPDGRSRSVSLRAYPELGAFIESLRSTLSGNLANLMRYYDVGFSGSEDDWQLTLDPVDEKIRKIVQTIRIHGSKLVLTGVESQQADGDRSVLTISQTGP